MNTNEHNEIISDFVKDSLELLEDVESDIISLDKKSLSEKEEVINKLFRTFHSIKGSAGFLGFDNVQKVAHAAENLLTKIRSGETVLKDEHREVLVYVTDFLKEAAGQVGISFNDEALFDEAFTAIKLIDGIHENRIDSPDKSGDIRLIITQEMVGEFVNETTVYLQEIEKFLLEWLSYE